MGVAAYLQTGIETTVQTYATSKSAALAGALAPLAVTGVTIYIMLIGWAAARGELHNSLNTILWKFFKITFIGSIAIGGGMYQQYVIDGISGLEGIFTTALGNAPNIGQLIDNSVVPIETISGELYAKANEPTIPDLGLLAAAVLCTLGQIVITIASIIPLVIAKVTVAILLAIGPAFVLLAMWPATQRFTESWLATTLASVMTVVVIAAICSLLPAFIQGFAQDTLDQINNVNQIQAITSLVIVIAGLAFLAWKSSEVGASLVSGASFGNPASSVAHYLMHRSSNKKPSNTIPNNQMANTGGSTGPAMAHQHVLKNLANSR